METQKPQTAKAILRSRMMLEESLFLISDYTTKLQSSRQIKKTTTTVFWTLWEKVRVGWFEILPCITMYITICEIDDQSKFDAWNRGLKTSALGQPRRMGWGGRWVGVLGKGATCTPMADSCHCVAKATTIL